MNEWSTGSHALSELLQCPKPHFPLKNEDF